VLDVATGTGNAAIAAARCGCTVAGVDYVEALLERGRERAAAEGLSVTFIEADAEHLPFPDASFDAVLSCVGVMFTPDHEQAAAELVRVCRPGGTFALANWTPAGFVGQMFRTVAAHVPPPPGLQPPGLWGTLEHLEQLLGHALQELTAARREFVFRFRSPAEFVDVFRHYYGPVRKAFDALDQTGREQLHEDLAALARQHHREPGPSIALPSEYLEAIAVRA
jgi:ubiquinone/menaquinone biosynthesis C-methylase UbiE